MAEIPTVARRYAGALLELAADAGAIDAVSADVEQLAVALAGEAGPLLRSCLFNPSFTHDERRGVLDSVAARLGLNDLTTRTLRLMTRKGRLSSLPGLISAFRELADARAGRLNVRVRTATSLSTALADDVRAALTAATGKDVRISWATDPTLLGGLVAHVEGKVFDASLRARLDQIRHNLLNATEPAVA